MRQVPSLNYQIFDPLSWWVPFYVQISICCSKIMRQMKEWDAVLTVELADEWKKCITTLDRIDEVPIPRSRIPFNFAMTDCEYKFHVFADSSKDVAAAAAYLRLCPCS